MQRNNRRDVHDEQWTRDEMRVHKNGIAALAAAVIKQWHLDGEPESDSSAIRAWKSVLEQSEEK